MSFDPNPQGGSNSAELFARVTSVENELRGLLRKKSSFDPEVREVRSRLRNAYEGLLLDEYEFAQTKDVEQSLWKTVFYRRIEDFRRRIRKASADPGLPGAAQQLQKAATAFRSFLGEASNFYLALLRKFEVKFGGSSTDHAISSHRCLIYLGDLARYTELHMEGDNRGKDWSHSAAYYFQAATVYLDGGNPHNQLAVLATYHDNELLAVYRYFRSLAVKTPFGTARENLNMLFEKNRAKYARLQPQAERTNSESKTIQQYGALIWRDLCTRFVCLQGVIFTKVNLDMYERVRAEVMRDLDSLAELGRGAVSPLLAVHTTEPAAGTASPVLQLVVASIFTLHNLHTAGASAAVDESYSQVLQRSMLQQMATNLLHEFVAALLLHCRDHADPARNGQVPLGATCFPVLLVFLEWWQANPTVAAPQPAAEPNASDPRAQCWTHMAALLTDLAACESSAAPSDAQQATEADLALPEDHELRGFEPLGPAHAALRFNPAQLAAGGDRRHMARRKLRILAAARALAGTAPLCYDDHARVFSYQGSRQAPPVGEVLRVADPPAAADWLNAGGPKQQPFIVATDTVDDADDDGDEVIVFQPKGLRSAPPDAAPGASSGSSAASFGSAGGFQLVALQGAGGAPGDAPFSASHSGATSAGLAVRSRREAPGGGEGAAQGSGDSREGQYALAHMQGLQLDLPGRAHALDPHLNNSSMGNTSWTQGPGVFHDPAAHVTYSAGPSHLAHDLATHLYNPNQPPQHEASPFDATSLFGHSSFFGQSGFPSIPSTAAIPFPSKTFLEPPRANPSPPGFPPSQHLPSTPLTSKTPAGSLPGAQGGSFVSSPFPNGQPSPVTSKPPPGFSNPNLTAGLGTALHQAGALAPSVSRLPGHAPGLPGHLLVTEAAPTPAPSANVTPGGGPAGAGFDAGYSWLSSVPPGPSFLDSAGGDLDGSTLPTHFPFPGLTAAAEQGRGPSLLGVPEARPQYNTSNPFIT